MYLYIHEREGHNFIIKEDSSVKHLSCMVVKKGQVKSSHKKLSLYFTIGTVYKENKESSCEKDD